MMMADPVTGKEPTERSEAIDWGNLSRKEKRKVLKKLKRKKTRTEAAIREMEEDERLSVLEGQLPLLSQEEAELAERSRREFEERERVWLEEAAARKVREEEDERRKKLLEEEERKAIREADDEYESVEEGPPEIIWQGNEIIIKKGRVKIAKGIAERFPDKEDDNRPTSNPLPPQSAAFSSCAQDELVSMHGVLDSVAQQVPNFGTEQDKAHCPFHLKTGTCRFGSRCSRVHFYPEKSCTLLVRNMYNGPGLTCEQDEGLEYTDEEIERCYEEFYEDVHTEFLKFGEIVNFKVCKNTSYHLRGNVYVHYKTLESAIMAYNIMNARYYGGKQTVCEFAGVTKWKVAICGEFMKSRLKTCSHGSACNFIHCFRNPGGDYEWADWDNPPPRYWIKKMVALFGASVESSYEKELESHGYNRHGDLRRMRKPRSYRHQSEWSYNEMDWSYSSSDGDELDFKKHQYFRHSVAREHSSKRSGCRVSDGKSDSSENTAKRRHQRNTDKDEDDESKTHRKSSDKNRAYGSSSMRGHQKNTCKSSSMRRHQKNADKEDACKSSSMRRHQRNTDKDETNEISFKEDPKNIHKDEAYEISSKRRHQKNTEKNGADESPSMRKNTDKDEAYESMFKRRHHKDTHEGEAYESTSKRRHQKNTDKDEADESLSKRRHQKNTDKDEADESLSKRRHQKNTDKDEADEYSSKRNQSRDTNLRQTCSRHGRRCEIEDSSSTRRKRPVYTEELENSESEDRSSSRRKRKVHSEEQEISVCKNTSKEQGGRELEHCDGHLDSYRHSRGSLNQIDGKHSSSEEIASVEVRYPYNSQSN